MGEPEEQIDADVLLKNIATEVASLLKRKGSIDESVAKGVRRSWDGLDTAKVTDTETYEATKTALEQLRDAVHKQVERRDQSYARLTDDIEKLEKAVKDGNLKTALALEQSSTERLKQLPGLSDQRREAASEKLVALAPEIKKLKQWRHWGTTQARESLIAEMEALIGAKESPAKIAQEVQRARATWKSWDQTGDSSPKTLWAKFDQACTKAYEPCQAHFDNLAEQRKSNLQKRLKICDELEKLEADSDWTSPSWRDLDKQVLDLVTSWKRAGPVDRRKRKKLETRYDAIFQKLDARFERERSRNVKQRTAMTEEVLALKESTDIPAAIERVKEIQKHWRPSVLSSRRDERKLWKEFKSACDDVFAVRDNERKSQSAEQEKNREARQAMLKKFESDSKRGDKAVLSMNSRIDKLREQWNDAGPVLPKHRSGLEKQFRNFVKTLQTRAREVQDQREQRIDAFIASLDALLTQYETGVNAQGEADVPAASLESVWPDIEQISDPARRSLNQRYERLCASLSDSDSSGAATDAEMSANETLRQEICLKLEVSADIDSPAEFSKARMQWQVDRLKKAMTGSASDDNTNDADATRKLMREYWVSGPVSVDAIRALQARFGQITSTLRPDLKIDLDFSHFAEQEEENDGLSDEASDIAVDESSSETAEALSADQKDSIADPVDTSDESASDGRASNAAVEAANEPGEEGVAELDATEPAAATDDKTSAEPAAADTEPADSSSDAQTQSPDQAADK